MPHIEQNLDHGCNKRIVCINKNVVNLKNLTMGATVRDWEIILFMNFYIKGLNSV